MALTPEEQAELQMLQQQLPQLQAQFEQLSAAQPQQAPAPQPRPQRQGPNAFEQFKHGLAQSAIETGLGIKSLFTELSPENRAVLEMMREDSDAMGGWATAGNVVGEIAQLAVPASKVSWLAKGAGKAAPAALIGGEAALGAGYGATLAGTEEDKSRVEGATEGAAGALLGLAGGKVAQKAAEGIKQSDAGKYLTELGVRLTPAQAAESGLVKALETAASLTPILGKTVKAERDKALDSFNKVMLNEAAPTGVNITTGGHQGVQQVKQAFDEAYDDAWSKAKTPTQNELANVMINASAIYDELGSGAGRIANKTFDALRRVHGASREESAKALREADSMLRKEADRAFTAQDWGLHDAINLVRNDIMDMAGEEARGALGAVNEKYVNFRTAREAASSLGAVERGDFGNKGIVNPRELNQAILKVAGTDASGRNLSSTGAAPLQQFAAAGTDTIGEKMPVPVFDWWRRTISERAPSLGLGSIAPLGADIALGRTAAQQHGAKIAEVLRQYGVDSAAGTALMTGEQ